MNTAFMYLFVRNLSDGLSNCAVYNHHIILSLSNLQTLVTNKYKKYLKCFLSSKDSEREKLAQGRAVYFL